MSGNETDGGVGAQTDVDVESLNDDELSEKLNESIPPVPYSDMPVDTDEDDAEAVAEDADDQQVTDSPDDQEAVETEQDEQPKDHGWNKAVQKVQQDNATLRRRMDEISGSIEKMGQSLTDALDGLKREATTQRESDNLDDAQDAVNDISKLFADIGDDDDDVASVGQLKVAFGKLASSLNSRNVDVPDALSKQLEALTSKVDQISQVSQRASAAQQHEQAIAAYKAGFAERYPECPAEAPQEAIDLFGERLKELNIEPSDTPEYEALSKMLTAQSESEIAAKYASKGKGGKKKPDIKTRPDESAAGTSVTKPGARATAGDGDDADDMSLDQLQNVLERRIPRRR